MGMKNTILITGGTGSLGHALTRDLLTRSDIDKIIILSRDELKQYEMGKKFPDERMRFFVGDVRDKERLRRAFEGVRYIIHAAALKQVPSCEYNPYEAVKTNVFGSQNVIEAAIDKGVEKVIATSTDKAVQPLNLYGVTKACMEKLVVQANAYSIKGRTKFSVVRYGNVMGSRGSVIPFFKSIAFTGYLPITHPDMTRFWLTLEQAVEFVLQSLYRMQGREIFVPKVPSMRITDLADAICPECEKKIVGIRPGEKIHELLITKDEARLTVEKDCYIIKPEFSWTDEILGEGWKPVPENFEYCSATNTKWLMKEELKKLI
jgi:UDP-N-acetylglucosamine 4,6-dehydratase/5-epimerase